MARTKKLSLLSVEALFKLRDDVAAALDQKAEAIKKQLRSLGEDYAEVGRIAIYGRKRGSCRMAWEWRASPTCPPSGLGSTRCSDFLRRLVSDSVETRCREADLI